MKKLSILSLGLLLLPLVLLNPSPAFADGVLSLSQTYVNVNVGQSVTVTAYPANYQVVNQTANSNTYAALANVSNNVITIYGVGNGSTQMTFCTYDNTCGTVYVTVGGSNNNFGQITLSQSSVSLNVNQSASVSVYNSFGGTVYISNNSNSSVVSAYVSGNTLSLTGLSSGSSTITVCGSNQSSCATLYVTVSGSSYGQITLGQSSVSLNANQTTSVSVYNSTGGSVYISNNSNSSVVSAYVSGNSISLTGLMAGSSILTVCGSNQSSCATLYVTVSGSSYTNVTFSQNPVSLNYQQSTTVSLYGNNYNYGNFYISSNSNSSVVSASVSGSSLYLYGQSQGSASIVVCQANNSCGTLNVTVGFGGGSGTLYLNTTTLPQYTVNQYYFSQLNVTGGNSPYTFSLTSGNLPSGISLGSSGQIFGTAVTGGTYYFSVRVTDTYGRTYQSPTLTLSGTGSVLGSQAYSNGTLVNDNGTIYITYKNLKTAFSNMNAFRGLGYNLNAVVAGSTASMFSSGYVVGSSNVAHPWGSWVKYGTTIYFVHETGLIPIPSYDIFLNNGGNAATVVNANSYDLARQILSVMSYSDTRLR